MNISDNLQRIQQRITQAEADSHRKSGSVLLLAVSKQQSVDAIKEAFSQGIADFAENYFQEALGKMQQLSTYPIRWHFIGPIQSNKAKGIAQHFNWVHSVSRIKIAQALNDYRSNDCDPIQVCLHINIEDEASKSGIAPSQAEELAQAIQKMPRLRLRGLMTIPPAHKNASQLYDLFNQLKMLMHALNDKLGLNMDTLSMGMSDDLVPAITAGSTIVRIGRAIFGEREGKNV